jgi:hypothetical protein
MAGGGALSRMVMHDVGPLDTWKGPLISKLNK